MDSYWPWPSALPVGRSIGHSIRHSMALVTVERLELLSILASLYILQLFQLSANFSTNFAKLKISLIEDSSSIRLTLNVGLV